MFLSFSSRRLSDYEEYSRARPVNVTNVKQTPGRWEQLQIVDGMLLHGCSQECASLPFVLRTNWGGGDAAQAGVIRVLKVIFSFFKQQSNSVCPDLDACENARNVWSRSWNKSAERCGSLLADAPAAEQIDVSKRHA